MYRDEIDKPKIPTPKSSLDRENIPKLREWLAAVMVGQTCMLHFWDDEPGSPMKLDAPVIFWRVSYSDLTDVRDLLFYLQVLEDTVEPNTGHVCERGKILEYGAAPTIMSRAHNHDKDARMTIEITDDPPSVKVVAYDTQPSHHIYKPGIDYTWGWLVKMITKV